MVEEIDSGLLGAMGLKNMQEFDIGCRTILQQGRVEKMSRLLPVKRRMYDGFRSKQSHELV